MLHRLEAAVLLVVTCGYVLKHVLAQHVVCFETRKDLLLVTHPIPDVIVE